MAIKAYDDISEENQKKIYSIISGLAGWDPLDSEGDCAVCGAWRSLGDGHDDLCFYAQACKLLGMEVV
jgi:hypothetical protein